MKIIFNTPFGYECYEFDTSTMPVPNVGAIVTVMQSMNHPFLRNGLPRAHQLHVESVDWDLTENYISVNVVA